MLSHVSKQPNTLQPANLLSVRAVATDHSTPKPRYVRRRPAASTSSRAGSPFQPKTARSGQHLDDAFFPRQTKESAGSLPSSRAHTSPVNGPTGAASRPIRTGSVGPSFRTRRPYRKCSLPVRMLRSPSTLLSFPHFSSCVFLSASVFQVASVGFETCSECFLAPQGAPSIVKSGYPNEGPARFGQYLSVRRMPAGRLVYTICCTLLSSCTYWRRFQN